MRQEAKLHYPVAILSEQLKMTPYLFEKFEKTPSLFV